MNGRLRFAAMATVLVACSLAVAVDEASAVGDAEPNNHFTQASGPLVSASKVSGAISASGDIDYYFFYVSSLSDVTVSAGTSGPSLDLYRYDGGYLRWVDDLGNGAFTKQMSPGLYYIRYAGSTGSYNVTVTGAGVTSSCPAGVALHGQVVSVTETLESHWTQATVSPQSGYTYRAEIGASGDIDYYFFYVSSLSDVTVGANTSGPSLDLYVYDGGYRRWVDDLGSGTFTKQMSPGLYYIRYAGSTGSYNFTVTGAGVTSSCPAGVALHGQVVSLPEVLETGYGQAQGPLAGGYTYRAELGASGDVDYYYFYVSSSSDVTVGANTSGPSLDLYRNDGVKLNWIDDLGSGTFTKRLSPGLYYIRHGGSTGSYDFTVTGARVVPDTRGPTTSCKAASGRKGRAITLRYRIADISPRALSITLVVKSSKGKVVKRFNLGSKRTNTWLSARWMPPARGRYSYSVTATDLAGNHQRKVIRGAIRVQ
jgi:hypothetical protein